MDSNASKQIEEKEFIHEEYKQNPFPFWGWLSAVILVTVLFFGAGRFYFSQLAERYAESSFLRVTNRQISLFLWQNPQYMRAHVKHKNGYLPAFEYVEKIGLNPHYADDYAIAPPEIFFLYHIWQRLLGNVCLPRAIPANEFRRFLKAAPEWAPEYWKEAPASYKWLVHSQLNESQANLSVLSVETLPLIVRQAFIGWKNYFFEGSEINQFQPSMQLLGKLLDLYPHYGRNYWCNIVGDAYLKSTSLEGLIEGDELSPFLRVALFNLAQVSS